MVDIRVVTPADLPTIAAWIKADPWHRDEARNDPAFLLTGKGLLTFCLCDDEGPLCYTRLDPEGDLIRAAVQFAPTEQISKRRLIIGMLKMFFPVIKQFARNRKSKGLIYESVSPTLIAFCEKQGFVSVGNDDYVWPTGDTTACA
jgi:hypothetical protein